MPTVGNRRERQVIIDRADRMLKQSRTLRKLSDELLEESRDIRSSMKNAAEEKEKPTKRR